MSSINWSKLVVAVVTLVAVTVLMIVHVVHESVGIPVITTVLGYMLGNGVAAASGQVVQPIYQRTHDAPAAPAAEWQSPDGTRWERAADGTWRRLG